MAILPIRNRASQPPYRRATLLASSVQESQTFRSVVPEAAIAAIRDRKKHIIRITHTHDFAPPPLALGSLTIPDNRHVLLFGVVYASTADRGAG